MTDWYEDEFSTGEEDGYDDDHYRDGGYDSDSYDDASIDSHENYHWLSTPASPPRRMTRVVEEEATLPTAPKFVVLSGYGRKAVEVEIQASDLAEKVVVPVDKPKFSWGAPKTAPVDLLQIVSEQESEAEKERLRAIAPPKPVPRNVSRDNYGRSSNGYPPGMYPDSRGRPSHHQRRHAPPASHDRLLANPRRAPVDNKDSRRAPSSSSNHHDHGRLLGRNTAEGDSRRVPSSSTTTTNSQRTDLLCIHPARHSPTCHLPHSFEEWTPKLCNYGERCSRKAECSFWHTEMESKREYLIRALRLDIVFFRKNKNQYLRTYRITL